MADDDKKSAPLLTTHDTGHGGRRRVAPKAFEASDVTRMRGLLIATLIGGVVTLVALVTSAGTEALRSPGPQSRPHKNAKLECSACHKDDRPPAKACAGCHGALPSQHDAHQELRKKGELGCPTCHAIHRADEGVSFLPNGDVIRYGTGWEEKLSAGATHFFPTKPVSVPLVPARACAKCHDAKSPTDPMAVCLIEGQEGLGLDRPTVCFDEHRAVTTRAGAGAKVAPGATTQRDAAWEAARTVAASFDRGPIRASTLRPLGWLGSGFAVALLAYALVHVRSRFVRKKRAALVEPRAELRPSAVKRLPVIDPTTCLGCYACVDACPYDVLEVRRFVAVLARPDDCCGLTLCEQRCPNGSLVVREGEAIEDRPDVDEHLESRAVPGLFLAGDLTGLPLIRNAINQGAAVARTAAERARTAERKPTKTEHDLIIVGAGPAGISAALEAKAQGLAAKTLEQWSVAASIKSFPRGKLVFDQPLGMPLVGELWLEESSKEELLAKWLRIVRRAEIDVEEGVRVTHVTPVAGGGFEITGVRADGTRRRFASRTVLLSIGRRGSPRKLDCTITPEAESNVFYSLADARSFAGKRVAVVGLGDTAMETAIALARQPDTTVTLVYRGQNFRRGKARNIDEVRRLAQAGRIRLLWETNVERVDAGRVIVRTPRGREEIAVDSLFVLIGSIPPWDFLESLGIRRVAEAPPQQ